jgi:hypothetical protein
MKNISGERETIVKTGNDHIWKSKGWLTGVSIVLEYPQFETADECNVSLQAKQAFSPAYYPSAVLEIVLKPVVSIGITHDYEI